MDKTLILPGNPRYQPSQLKGAFGYDNLYQEAIRVELATLAVLNEIGLIPDEAFDFSPEALANITTTEIDQIERKVTKHDVRALVRKMQELTNKKIAPWIHIPLTSYDVLDTARSLQFLSAYNQALKPSIIKVIEHFVFLVRKNADVLQIGRTHGQHALPITVGFWLATILDRIVFNFFRMYENSKRLVGKISGAVGAHNAQIGLRFNVLSGKKSFEQRVLEKLGLEPALSSTQILPPEPLANFLFSCVTMSATLGQFGRDCRHLMRSEIGEIAETFEKGQVGSSTMAHKRNPINFENLEGTWLKTKSEFGKVLDTLICEHQRDLVGSSVSRDYPVIVVNLQHQLNTLLKENKEGVPFINRITVDQESCERNFQQSSRFILAEPLYIVLQMAGYQGDAHELVNHTLMPMAQKLNIPLIVALEEHSYANPENKKLATVIKEIPDDIYQMLEKPENYTGDAKEKALEIAANALAVIKVIGG